MNSGNLLIRSWSGMLVFLLAALIAAPVAAEEASFQIQLGQDGETIGEMQPVFIELRKRPLPAISVREVARRYRQLFEEAEEPEVRVDALHRINNLQAVAGDVLDMSLAEEQDLYRRALDSYEMIVGSGIYEGRLDELLYQTARAYDFIGEEANAAKRLEQLIGLYPDSRYANEARFRIAEYRFSAGQYDQAARAYRDVLQKAPDSDFADQAVYMLGWSQFKQGNRDQASRTFIRVLDDYHSRSDGFANLTKIQSNMLEDTFRILSIMAAYEGGAVALERLLQEVGGRPYAYLLYDRLADYYLANERYMDSVAAGRAFLEAHPGHPEAPDMAIQVVNALEEGRFDTEVREAKRAFIQRFAGSGEVTRLSSSARTRLLDYLDEMGRWHYRQAQAQAAEQALPHYRQAGLDLERWSELAKATDRLGENLVLAADAWVNAGEPARALPLYRRAAYEVAGFEGNADAGYATVTLHRRALEGEFEAGGLDALLEAGRRFVGRFGEDGRASAVRAALANRLYEAGRLDDAADIAAPLLAQGSGASMEQRLAGSLVMANVAYDQTRFAEAEQHYSEALSLAAGQPGRQDPIRRKIAESIYQQGQAAEKAGQAEKAVDHYQRLAKAMPQSELVPQARFDAANVWLKAENWSAAIEALKDFRARHPDSRWVPQVPEKLIYAYRQAGQPGKAANELLADLRRDRPEDPEALWKVRLQAAELYEEAGLIPEAMGIFESYLREGPETLVSHEYRQDIRQRLVREALAANQEAAAQRWRKRLLAAEQAEQAGRTQRSRMLAGQAALALAREHAEAVRAIPLTRPLKKSLKRKRAALEQAVKMYQTAQSFGLAAQVAESDFRLAELYRGLARDLMTSERPDDLTALQRQQYDLLLEEQAFPFEEKAIALYERNQARIRDGIWNPWIEKSLEALGKMFPARYARQTQWMEWSHEAL